jgi:peroxiredoxin Q/BCP
MEIDPIFVILRSLKIKSAVAELNEGMKAPDFTGSNQQGEPVSLAGLKGKKVILYFYPKDNTPGCTAEACNLRDNYKELTDKGFEVIGVSADSEKSHQNFIAKYDLPFNLVSDKEKEVLKAYGAWGVKKMYGKEYEGILRKTFIIDEKGTIVKIINKVDTKNHTGQILEALD